MTVVLADTAFCSTWNVLGQPNPFHVKRAGGKDPE